VVVVVDCVVVCFYDLSLHIQLSACQVQIILPCPRNAKFDWRSLIDGSYGIALYMYIVTRLYTGLCGGYYKEVKFALCTFAGLWMNECHIYSLSKNPFWFSLRASLWSHWWRSLPSAAALSIEDL